MTPKELDGLLNINLKEAFKHFDKVTKENSVKTDADSRQILESIEVLHNRRVTEEDVKAFEERCRKRDDEFKRISDRMRPDASFYNFQYGVKNIRS